MNFDKSAATPSAVEAVSAPGGKIKAKRTHQKRAKQSPVPLDVKRIKKSTQRTPVVASTAAPEGQDNAPRMPWPSTSPIPQVIDFEYMESVAAAPSSVQPMCLEVVEEEVGTYALPSMPVLDMDTVREVLGEGHGDGSGEDGCATSSETNIGEANGEECGQRWTEDFVDLTRSPPRINPEADRVFQEDDEEILADPLLDVILGSAPSAPYAFPSMKDRVAGVDRLLLCKPYPLDLSLTRYASIGINPVNNFKTNLRIFGDTRCRNYFDIDIENIDGLFGFLKYITLKSTCTENEMNRIYIIAKIEMRIIPKK